MRKDGKRIKHADPMYTIVPHIMSERNDSMNMIELFFPIVPMNRYIKEKHAQGIEISHLALMIAAYVRTVAEFPQLNRFIVNRKIFARKGIQVGMVVLKPNGHTMSKMYLDPADDVLEVNRKLMEYIAENRVDKGNNATDDLIAKLLSVPGLARVGVALLKMMDKHGWLPESIIKASPFHASMTITNLASIGTNNIFHHIYNFGTTSQLFAMGNLRNMPRRAAGAEGFERCLPVGLVMDERICDGSYYAKAFRKMEAYLKNPALMEGAPEVCIREWEMDL